MTAGIVLMLIGPTIRLDTLTVGMKTTMRMTTRCARATLRAKVKARARKAEHVIANVVMNAKPVKADDMAQKVARPPGSRTIVRRHMSEGPPHRSAATLSEAGSGSWKT